MNKRRHPLRRWLLPSVLLISLLAASGYAVRYVGWPAVKAWRVEKDNRTALAYLDQGDAPNALLTARRSLQSTTQNPDAWRIAAQAEARRDRPDAVWYQKGLVHEEPSLENRLELIRLALHFGLTMEAQEAVERVGQDGQEVAEFHRLAAATHAAAGAADSARTHLQALLRLEPQNDTARLQLTALALNADPEGLQPELRARLRSLAENPELRRQALVLLLRDEQLRPQEAGSTDLVKMLQSESDLGLDDRLLLVASLEPLDPDLALSLLRELQAEVISQPVPAGQVLRYLSGHGRSDEVQPWLASLPAETRNHPEVQYPLAEFYLEQGDDAALEALLRLARWPHGEHLRSALLAYAYRKQGRANEFANAWKLALAATGSDLQKTAALLGRVDQWRWMNERHDVIWRLFALVPNNRSVQQSLIAWERHHGRTAGLNRIFARIYEIDPHNGPARNNFAYTSLLLNLKIPEAARHARELATAAPNNAYYGTTHALALHLQGETGAALALLEAQPLGARNDSVRILLRAVFNAALGRSDPATDLINSVVLADLLPEERQLAQSARQEIARIERRRGQESRLLALAPDGHAPTAGFLTLLDPTTRAAASPEMQLADSLYAVPDWEGLAQLLDSTPWPREQHLQSALQAYVEQRAGRESRSRDAWQQAIALADRNPARLQNLRALVTQWQWTAERLETLNLIFARQPSDRLLLTELLLHYRDVRRTSDLRRVLGLHLSGSMEPSDEAVAHAYYSLLLDANVAQAHVQARQAFEAAPADLARRMVYVFSLWKQERAAEALPLLMAVPAESTTDLLPVPLLRATIEAQLGQVEAARSNLARFRQDTALPEELALARRLER